MLALAAAALLCGESRALEMWSYETEHLRLVYYSKEHEYLVQHLARCFENSLRFHSELFHYTPSEKVVVLIHDFGDFGHGGTSTVPWNYITIGIEPFDYAYETMPTNERMNWLMHHELVHVVATDKAAGADRVARRLFTGKVAPTAEEPLSMFYSYLTSPRWYSPRWYHEGIAVFLETWMAGGVGRVLGGYDEMAFRAMVQADRRFYDVVGLESEGTTIDFQVGQNSYLYGTRFVTWLALEHGPDKVIEWFDRADDSKRYFSAQFRKVYGVSLEDEWRRWIEAEHRWQQDNLATIREFPVTADEPIAPALGSASRPYWDAERQQVYVAVAYPAHPARVVALGLDGSMRTLTAVRQPALYYVTSLAWNPQDRKLFYTTDNTRGWRDLVELDPDTGKRRTVLRDCRTGDLTFDPVDRSLWGVQHHNGLSSIVRIPPPYDRWETLLTLDFGRDVFDLDLSPDGRTLVAGLIEISGRQRLVRMDTAKLAAGDGSFEELHEFQNNGPENFVFSADGKYLFGTSYYTGVSNVFRYDFLSGAMEAVTNAETGYFRPTPIADDRLLAFRYTPDGMLPVLLPVETTDDVNAIRYLGQQVAVRWPEVQSWNAGSPLQIDLDKVTTYSGEYHALRRIGLASVYPVVEGYRDSWAAGARLNFADPVALQSLELTAAVSPADEVGDGEQYHVYGRYRHWPWTVEAGHNPSDFYDLFGPTKVGRKGNFASVDYENYLIHSGTRTLSWNAGVAAYSDLDTLPLYQNVEATITRYSSVTAGLDFSDLRRTIGGVEPERGLSWSLKSTGSRGDGNWFPQAHLDFSYGIPTGIDHSSVWLHGSAGRSFGDETETLSNFYFGAFGNNWIDHRAVRRFRRFYAFPGVELDSIEAHEYGKLTVEWTLPPIRFRRAGIPGLYANWLQFTVFGSGIDTNFDSSLPRRRVGDVGVQADLKIVMFSNLESTFSVGWASAFEEGLGPEDELMVSLKLLR